LQSAEKKVQSAVQRLSQSLPETLAMQRFHHHAQSLIGARLQAMRAAAATRASQAQMPTQPQPQTRRRRLRPMLRQLRPTLHNYA
jgi:hypothetical protein